jgi:hypothetical protein
MPEVSTLNSLRYWIDMGIDAHMFRCRVSLKPHGVEHARCKILLDDNTWFDQVLREKTTFEINQELITGPHRLSIQYLEKSQNDHGQAIEIQTLDIHDITDPRFIWRGVYRPEYPEPWATQQRELGLNLEPELTNTDYLGWSGRWDLLFDSPVFTWIHRVQNLGWVYD